MGAYDFVDVGRVDPAATRVPISGADGLELVTIGAPLDGRYEPPSWG